MLLSTISFLSSLHWLKVIPERWKFHLATHVSYHMVCRWHLFPAAYVQHFICAKACVRLAHAFLRKPFNPLFSVVPDISACIYLENKGLALTELLKNYQRKESMTFSEENISLFCVLGKFPNASIV